MQVPQTLAKRPMVAPQKETAELVTLQSETVETVQWQLMTFAMEWETETGDMSVHHFLLRSTETNEMPLLLCAHRADGLGFRQQPIDVEL